MELIGKKKVSLPKGIVNVTVSGPTHGTRSGKCFNTVTEYLMRKIYGDDPHVSHIANLMQRIAIGTGTTPIEYTDTSIGQEVAVESLDSSNPPAVVTEIQGVNHHVITATATFSPGTLVGSLTEVGLLYSDFSLLAGTLIKNESGDPAPIQVAADDQIVVSYSLAFDLTVYPVLFDTGTITVNGDDHDFTVNHVNFFETFATSLYVKNPSRDLSSNADKTIFVNGTKSTTSNSSVTRTNNYDAVGRSMEWIYEATVFATFDNGDISSLGLLPGGRIPSNTSPDPIVLINFTPAITRPVDNKIVIRYRFKIYW